MRILYGFSHRLLVLLIQAFFMSACTSSAPIHLPRNSESHPPARVGKVTREMILLDGGVCDATDVCFDKKSQRDFDCDVEFYCVPTSIDPNGNRSD